MYIYKLSFPFCTDHFATKIQVTSAVWVSVFIVSKGKKLFSN